MTADIIEQKTQTIRNLEALATKPGTPEEGELARARAIEIALKYNIPSIFTQPDYKPVVDTKPVTPPSPPPKPKLHRDVVTMEDCLGRWGWHYYSFSNNGRVYRNRQRPDEEIKMEAHWFGTFSCIHTYKPSGSVRPAGNDADGLSHFFNSIPYRYELWPRPQTRRPSYTDFYDPLFDGFDFKRPNEPEPIQEEAKTSEPPPVQPTPPEPPVPQEDPLDVMDQKIGAMIKEAERKEQEIRKLLAEKLI